MRRRGKLWMKRLRLFDETVWADLSRISLSASRFGHAAAMLPS